MNAASSTAYKFEDTIIKCTRTCSGGLITKGKFPVARANSWNLCID